MTPVPDFASPALPDSTGHFGPFGGRYVPETLVHPLQQLEDEYWRAQQDPEFQRELERSSCRMKMSPPIFWMCLVGLLACRRVNVNALTRPL